MIRARNWRGALVEPQVDAFQILERNHAGQPGRRLPYVAIGPENSEIGIFTRRSVMVSVASMRRQLLVKPGHPGSEVLELRVPCWTLATLLEKCGNPPHVDLLQIDAEGFDWEIIRSIDFARTRPSILRYEHRLLSRRDQDACLRHLAGFGYRFLLEDFDTIAYGG